jgi:hypothetical protein
VVRLWIASPLIWHASDLEAPVGFFRTSISKVWVLTPFPRSFILYATAPLKERIRHASS